MHNSVRELLVSSWNSHSPATRIRARTVIARRFCCMRSRYSSVSSFSTGSMIGRPLHLERRDLGLNSMTRGSSKRRAALPFHGKLVFIGTRPALKPATVLLRRGGLRPRLLGHLACRGKRSQVGRKAIKVDIDDRGGVERQRLADEQAAHHGIAQGLADLGAGTG